MKLTFGSLAVPLLLLTWLGFPRLVLADAKAVADARKTLADAVVADKKAAEALTKARETVKSPFIAKSEYVAVQAAVTKAKSDVDKATAPVIEKIHASTDYLAAKSVFDAQAIQLSTLKAQAANDPNKVDLAAVTTATKERAAAKETMTKLETDALEADSKVSEAKTALAAAQGALDEQNKKLEELIADDPACQTAKKDQDDAKQKVIDARAALVAAQKQVADENKSRRGGNRPAGGAAGSKPPGPGGPPPR